MEHNVCLFLRPNRTLLCIEGPDRFAFLQGLITQDVTHLEEPAHGGHHRAVYTFFLNVQGRYQFDAFLIAANDCIWLSTDCTGPQLLRHLSLYKLRRQVSLRFVEGATTYAVMRDLPLAEMPHNILYFRDPRAAADDATPWYHIITLNAAHDPFTDIAFHDPAHYHAWRIQKGYPENDGVIIEGVPTYPYGADFVVGRTFPLEVGAERLNAMSFKKGCYLGQEPVARAHYQGVVRKQLCTFSAPCDPFDPKTLVGATLTIPSDPHASGSIVSCAYYQSTSYIMAMLREYTGGPVMLQDKILHSLKV